MRILIVCFSFNKSRVIGDPSVWYRCYNFAEMLQQQGIICDLCLEEDLNSIEDYIGHYQKIIFFRPRQSPNLINFISKARRLNIHCLASYDDLIFDVGTYSISSTLKSFAKRGLIQSRYRDWANAFDLFDDFIVSGEFLKVQVERIKPAANVYIFDNILPNNIRRVIKNNRLTKNNSELKIGYFGGGASHIEDLLMIQSSLKSICESRGARLVLPHSLAIKLDSELQGYVDGFERASYIEMMKICCSVNVCIAPLILDSNSQSKSAIKYTEAISCGNSVVATKIDAYKPFESQKTLMFNNTNDWYESLNQALDLEVSEDDINEVNSIVDLRFKNTLNKFLEI